MSRVTKTPKKASSNASPPLWLRRAKEIIEAHYRDRLSLRDVARAVSVHPVHVARQFRRYVGMSVGSFIRLRRIEFARQNLATTDKPLVDIALESGFTQQAHFTTAFRQITGVTPLEYRKQAATGLSLTFSESGNSPPGSSRGWCC
jgi:AraC family transcriptional regulator